MKQKEMRPKISVILTAWARPQYLEEQVERILDQTVAPHEIVLWYNGPPPKTGFLEMKQKTDFKNAKYVKKILCDYNFGIIPRFSIAAAMEGYRWNWQSMGPLSTGSTFPRRR